MACPLSLILNSPSAAGETVATSSSGDAPDREEPRPSLRVESNLNKGNESAKSGFGGRKSLDSHLEVLEASPRRKKRRLNDDNRPDAPLVIGLPPRTPDKPSSCDSSGRSHLRGTPFSVFSGLLRNNDLMLQVAAYLSVGDIVNLYSLSKSFHYLFNSHYSTYILQALRTHAPTASEVFPYHVYKSLCVEDPGRCRQETAADEVGKIPSLRYLVMAVHRYDTIREILEHLASQSLRLPAGAINTLAKIWAVMDIATNAKRSSLLRDSNVWTNNDLYVAAMFFIKLDMTFTDPIDGTGQEVAVRKLLLSQKSFASVLRALKQQYPACQLNLLQMYVRTSYRPSPDPAHAGLSIMGIPAHEVGRGELEGWGTGSSRLLRPDELVIREAQRRSLGLGRELLEMMRYGFVDEDNFEDFRTSFSNA